MTLWHVRPDAARRSRTELLTPLPFLLLLFFLMVVIDGCGVGAQSDTADTVDAHPRAAPSKATNGASVGEDEDTASEGRASEGLASHACDALLPALAANLDPRLRKRPDGGGSLDVCSYGTAPAHEPALQLILQFIPSPTEPSVSVAMALCQKLIKQTIEDKSYTTVAAPPPLGEEAVVASIFKRDETGLVGDETTYVADWREGGTCASLIFSSHKPARPPSLSKFIDLAVSVSLSGA